MGRYGPPVYERDRSGEILADALMGSVNTYVGARANREARELERERTDLFRRNADFEFARAGGRRGTAPDEYAVRLAVPERIPTSLDPAVFGSEISGGQRDDDPALAEDSFGRNLAAELRGSRPSAIEDSPLRRPVSLGRQAPLASAMFPTVGANAQDLEPLPGGGVPGAFDLKTGSFNSVRPDTRPAIRVSQADRYTPIDDETYIDEEATPEARGFGRQIAGTRLAHELQLEMTDAERRRKREALRRAGVPEHQLDAAVDDPTLADRILFPSKAGDPYGGRGRDQWLKDETALINARNTSSPEAQVLAEQRQQLRVQRLAQTHIEAAVQELGDKAAPAEILRRAASTATTAKAYQEGLTNEDLRAALTRRADAARRGMSDTELLLEWSRPSASPAAQSSSSTPGATKAPLTAAEKAEAKKNPEFQAFLMGKGYTAEDWK